MKAVLIVLGYALSCVGVVLLAPSELETANLVGIVFILGSLLLVDLASYTQGMRKGLNIANKVMYDLCKDKKIKVTIHE